MYLSYNQKETNQIIYNEIEKASKYIHITTMFFNDTDLPLNFIKLLNHKIKKARYDILWNKKVIYKSSI